MKYKLRGIAKIIKTQIWVKTTKIPNQKTKQKQTTKDKTVKTDIIKSKFKKRKLRKYPMGPGDGVWGPGPAGGAGAW